MRTPRTQGNFEELLDRLYLRHGIRKKINASIQDPYGWCFFGAIHHAFGYVKDEPLKRPIAMFFDRKEKVKGQSLDYFNKYVEKHDPEQRFLKSATHVDRLLYTPLQAAVLAYEAAKGMYNLRFNPELGIRKSLEILNARGTVGIGYDDKRTLAPVIERMIREGRL